MKSALLARRTILAVSIDTESYVEEAFDSIVSKGNHSRTEAYDLLTIYLEDSQRHQTKRCIPILEKLPTLLETAQIGDFDAFLRFISVLADNITTEIQNAWNKNMNKILTTILRMINGREAKARSMFLIAVVQRLASSRIRSSLIPFVKQFKDIGFQLLSFQHNLTLEQREIITDMLASVISLESVAQWNSSLNDILLEMAAMMSKLTVFPSRASSQDKPQVSLFTLDTVLIPTITGVSKAQIIEGLFTQLNKLYSKILKNGCATTFSSLDLTGFVVLERAVLTLFADVNTNDPAVRYLFPFLILSFIPHNEDRISKVDVALVSSKLKMAILYTVQHILQLNLPGFVRYGSLFLHPICVLLGRKEVNTVPMLLHEVLSTLQIALRVIPNSTWLMLQSTGSAQVLLQLAQVQCELISGERKHFSALDMSSSSFSSSSSKNKKDMQALQLEQEGNLIFHATPLVLAAASFAQRQQLQQQQQQNGVLGKRKHYVDQDIEPANDALVVHVLATIDALVLHAGRFLIAQPEGKQFLEQVQISLLFPLLAMQRGILPCHFHDKKMHRLFAERVRHSQTLQAAVLRTAGHMFLVTGAAEHIYLPIVQDVAQTAMRQIGCSAEVCREAQQLLLMTGHLVHPSVLPMPAVNPTALAADYLARDKKRRRQEEEQQDIEQAKISERTESSSKAVPTSTDVSVAAASSQMFAATLASTDATEKAALSYAAKEPTVAATSTKTTVKASSTKVASKTEPKKAAAKVAMDEDDDIPDIDISSDQE